MRDRKRLLFGGLGLATLVVLAGVAIIGPSDFFLPEQATVVMDETGGSDVEVLERGTFVSSPGHTVTGNVSLIRDEEGLALRFESYEQTQGPDVFVFVTPSSSPDTTSEIAAGTKILVDGGADGGESTKVGTFTQRLPDSVDAADINGVGIWCERFRTPFGYAALTPVGT